MTLQQPLLQQVSQLFSSAFGAQPQVVARAPGRVEVLGNHTDYNEGVVLSAAINREIVVAASFSSDGKFAFVSDHFPSVTEVSGFVRQGGHSWVNYPLGVCAMLNEAGFPIAPCRIAVCGNVPLGAGLSSSAALEVATALAVAKLNNHNIDPVQIAKLCQKAEHDFAGANTGLLDQFSSLFGKKDHLLYIDFRTLEHTAIPVNNPTLRLAITPSGVTHALVSGEYNARRVECAEAAAFFTKRDPSVHMLRDVSSELLLRHQEDLADHAFRRALHVVGENERVRAGVEALQQKSLTRFGKQLYASHESSRDNFENSCPELDALVAIARNLPGVVGSRLTGGGFGGATLTFLQESVCDSFTSMVPQRYKDQTGKETTVFIAEIADGAGIAG